MVCVTRRFVGSNIKRGSAARAHGWPGDVRYGLGVLGWKAPCGSTQLTEIKHGGYTGKGWEGGRALRSLELGLDLNNPAEAAAGILSDLPGGLGVSADLGEVFVGQFGKFTEKLGAVGIEGNQFQDATDS
jgi:hypothetical protein